MDGIAEAHLVPVEWRKRYCDAIKNGDMVAFMYIFHICDLKIVFPIDSAKRCHCWSVPIDYEFGDEIVAYPQCQQLAERISSGTCDCKKTKRGRVVWFTSVHLACYYGQLEVVKWLMRFYQNVDPLKEKALLTPLMVTSLSQARDEAPDIASLLIERGANIDEQTSMGFSALHLAVINNNAELVKLYLQRGASIDVPCCSFDLDISDTVELDKCGLSPLWLAAKLLPPGSQCEELLLASGASVAEGYEECSPLIAVGSKEGLEGILRYLKSPGFDINHEFPIFGTHLMAAIHEYYSSEQDDARRRMWFQVIEHYLKTGINVNAVVACGQTALSNCLQNYEIMALLISYGANVKHVDRNGLTILMELFMSGEPPSARSCVRLLLENGVDVNAVCDEGCNALRYALDVSYEKISDIRLLFEYNIDIEGSYMHLLQDQVKPVLYAAYDYENFEVAELCLQYGLDMTKQSWLLDTSHLPMGLRGNDALYKKLLHLYQNPLDLSVLARNKVRRSLGRRDVSKAVTQLGLPKHLEDFVACK